MSHPGYVSICMYVDCRAVKAVRGHSRVQEGSEAREAVRQIDERNERHLCQSSWRGCCVGQATVGHGSGEKVAKWSSDIEAKMQDFGVEMDKWVDGLKAR